MKNFLTFIIKIITNFHQYFQDLNLEYNVNLNDKQLHFLVFGVLCLLIFIIVQWTFKLLAKWKITSISLIYTFTVAIVLAFAIEIGQLSSKTGNMEFADIVYGIYGFIVFFILYEIIVKIVSVIAKRLNNRNIVNRTHWRNSIRCLIEYFVKFKIRMLKMFLNRQYIFFENLYLVICVTLIFMFEFFKSIHHSDP